ncbi:MAG: PAS domain S-box protein, partial [Rhodospirillaceae bacterium]|nr:PAS domain S-box protein [Rhodospirillaceae bacterium]
MLVDLDVDRRILDGSSGHQEIIIQSGGSPRSFDLRISPLRNHQAQVTGKVFVLRDITDRKNVEIDLRASETRVRAILDTAFDAIVSIDQSGRIVEFNNAATRIFGHARGDALGKTLSELIVPPIYRAAHEAGLKRYLETGRHSVLNRLVEVEALRADGSHIPVELSITEVPVAGGRLFTAMLRDISERKQFQSQLAVAERQRAQLTRHFSPNMVEELMQAGGRIGIARTQPMAVLFSDLYDYTEMIAEMSGEQVIALLRDFHAIVEDAVFNHGGTLDKYIGDGVMATFGTPSSGPMDAHQQPSPRPARSCASWRAGTSGAKRRASAASASASACISASRPWGMSAPTSASS